MEGLGRVAGAAAAQGRVIMRTENLTPKQFNHIINHESGVLGVSETSSDMHDLIERQASDIRAAEAVERGGVTQPPCGQPGDSA